ncbi:MAG: hypothetical protein Q7R22_017885 [Verrucomicrobiota bacterium JB025]|nr:hypothetical protein [Verrucomicrobiota bacterium JB025]
MKPKRENFELLPGRLQRLVSVRLFRSQTMKEEINIELLDEDKLHFIKEQVEQNQRFHIDCSDALREQVNRVLASILVSSSALIGFGATHLPQNTAIAGGALAMGLHLCVVGGYLANKGMQAHDVQAMGNEPDSLLRNEYLEYPAVALIAGELRAKQTEILIQKNRNSQRGLTLNRSIKGALMSPVTFLISFLTIWAVVAACHQSASLDQAVEDVVSMVLMRCLA